MFIELEDLSGRPLFFLAKSITCMGTGPRGNFCVADGISYDVNNEPEEIRKTVVKSLEWEWGVNNA